MNVDFAKLIQQDSIYSGTMRIVARARAEIISINSDDRAIKAPECDFCDAQSHDPTARSEPSTMSARLRGRQYATKRRRR